MVLGPGGPCTAIRKKKEEDGTHITGVCNRTESHVWYSGKCKGCYEVAARIGKRKMETLRNFMNLKSARDVYLANVH